MTSSYTVNNGLEKPEAGDQEGAWGGTLNTNFDIIDRVLSGVGSISLSGTTHTLTTTDGTLTDGMYRVLVFTGALGANNTVTISPNDQDKLYFIVNNTTDSGSSGPYSVIIKQGTGDTVTVENGRADIVYADGAGSGAAVTSLGTQIGKQSFDVFNYVATAGQTTFSGADAASQTLAYNVGNLFVTVNGTVLKTGTDYTATNGTSIVLTDAATVGDEISIFAFNTFSVGPSKTITLFKYSATAGQTTFSGSDSASQTLAYTAGMIIVTLNGVVLDTSDYTASNGTSVVLDSGASASDELNIIAFTAFNAANVTAASADFSIGDDLSFTSDGAIINMGADNDVTLTHVHNTGLILSAGDNDTILQLDSNNDDAGAAPRLILNRTSASPADNDDGGKIEWHMENDNNQQFSAASIKVDATDVSDGSEQGMITIAHAQAGTEDTNAMYVGHLNGKVYIYNNTADLETLRLRQDNASCTNYGVVMIHDGAGTAGYFYTAGAATALYGYCGAANYGVRGYSIGSYGGYFSSSSSYGRGSYHLGSGSKYFIASYSSTYGAYSNGGYYSSTDSYLGSDSRLKDVTSQITTSDGILAKVNSLKPIMYTWKENSDGYVKDASPQCGFLAQEVKDVFPDLITEVEVPDCSDEMHDNGRDTKTLNEELGTTFGMSYEKLSVYLAAALQEASAKIDALEARIKTLEDAD
jgi:hypothetical protein